MELSIETFEKLGELDFLAVQLDYCPTLLVYVNRRKATFRF